nr:MAG TPA: hypothetical protein [Caudoviricetes sp.]
MGGKFGCIWCFSGIKWHKKGVIMLKYTTTLKNLVTILFLINYKRLNT